MWKLETIITWIIIFVTTGFVAYVVEAVWFRGIGKIGRYEGLWEYFKKIDQKNGNITAGVWAGIWVALMIICGFVMYLAS